MNKCLISLVLIFAQFCETSNTHIRVYKFTRCNYRTYYPVTVKDVSLEIENGYVHVSGSLTTDYNIDGPVRASLLVKRYIKWIRIWTPIPCIGNVGSCNYRDLCHWGKPPNDTCPERFLQNNVPCRCPISAGTYTIDPSDFKIPLFKVSQQNMSFDNENVMLTTPQKKWVPAISSVTTPTTGTYYVRALITTSRNKLMTCYEFYLDYKDNSWTNQFEYEYSENNELDNNI